MVVCDLLGRIRGIEIGCTLFIRAFVPIGDMGRIATQVGQFSEDLSEWSRQQFEHSHLTSP